jgi:uncharacterized protein (TIGR00369 family)
MSFKPAQSDFESIVTQKIKQNHFTNHIGFEVVEMQPGSCVGRIAITEQLKQQIGFLHGGVTMSVADICMGISAFTLVNKGEQVVTANLLCNFLNPAIGEYLYGIGTVKKAGKKLYFCECELWTEKQGEKLVVATASCTMAVVEIIS